MSFPSSSWTPRCGLRERAENAWHGRSRRPGECPPLLTLATNQPYHTRRWTNTSKAPRLKSRMAMSRPSPGVFPMRCAAACLAITARANAAPRPAQAQQCTPDPPTLQRLLLEGCEVAIDGVVLFLRPRASAVGPRRQRRPPASINAPLPASSAHAHAHALAFASRPERTSSTSTRPPASCPSLMTWATWWTKLANSWRRTLQRSLTQRARAPRQRRAWSRWPTPRSASCRKSGLRSATWRWVAGRRAAACVVSVNVGGRVVV